MVLNVPHSTTCLGKDSVTNVANAMASKTWTVLKSAILKKATAWITSSAFKDGPKNAWEQARRDIKASLENLVTGECQWKIVRDALKCGTDWVVDATVCGSMHVVDIGKCGFDNLKTCSGCSGCGWRGCSGCSNCNFFKKPKGCNIPKRCSVAKECSFSDCMNSVRVSGPAVATSPPSPAAKPAKFISPASVKCMDRRGARGGRSIFLCRYLLQEWKNVPVNVNRMILTLSTFQWNVHSVAKACIALAPIVLQGTERSMMNLNVIVLPDPLEITAMAPL